MPTLTQVSYSDISEVYLQELRRGNQVDLRALADKFPHFANRILAEFPTMAALEVDLGKSKKSFPIVPSYQLLEEIGRGSSGVVFKAKHETGRLAAIKLVQLDPEFPNLSRLDREIESLCRLDHPHVVTIESFGTVEDYLYIVTNLVEGITFADLLGETPSVYARHWASELRSDFGLLANWGCEIASALEYIHQNKIIHRDVKPSNLLIDRVGKCWIIDFGLAKFDEVGKTVTLSGQIAGTPRYMAPEQLRGIVDARCDVYSLGRTLYDLARVDANQEDLSSKPLATCLQNSQVPQELGKIIDKACEPHVERRYQSAKEMVAVLARFLNHKTPSDRRRLGKRLTEQEFKASMRRKVRFAAGSGLLCLGAASATLLVQMLPKRPEPAMVSSALKPHQENASLQKLASVIENEETGLVEVIGEALKHSVVSQSGDKESADKATSRIDRIVAKVTTEGLKPGELDSLIKDYRKSPIMNANKVTALSHVLHNSTLNSKEKERGHRTLKLFSLAIASKIVDNDKADRMLASLFQGEIPKLEQIVSIRIPDQTIASWLKLVESSFENEFRSLNNNESPSNQELISLMDTFLERSE